MASMDCPGLLFQMVRKNKIGTTPLDIYIYISEQLSVFCSSVFVFPRVENIFSILINPQQSGKSCVIPLPHNLRYLPSHELSCYYVISWEVFLTETYLLKYLHLKHHPPDTDFG